MVHDQFDGRFVPFHGRRFTVDPNQAAMTLDGPLFFGHFVFVVLLHDG